MSLFTHCKILPNLVDSSWLWWIMGGILGKQKRRYILSELKYNKVKVKNDHRSKFPNLSNWKEEAWKNQGFNGIRTRDLRVTGALLYQLSYEATHWEWGSNPVEALIFFRLLLSNCLNWKIYCDDRSSLSSTTAVQRMNYFIYTSHQYNKDYRILDISAPRSFR